LILIFLESLGTEIDASFERSSKILRSKSAILYTEITNYIVNFEVNKCINFNYI